MRLLLDTHAAIWALTADRRLSTRARDLIEADDNEVSVSAASIWEIAIKFALGKAGRPPFSGTDAIRYFREAGFVSLDVKSDHVAAAGELPPLHADPFDRLLVAQALLEPMRLVTQDPRVAAYSDTIITI
jgi:PIN domain nuclease of toxin-antitoxin system